MAQWPPHVTVATVVFSEGKYLMVEERDKTTKQLVFNQPAGHLDPGESLSEAAVRETLEETGWDVELTGLLGLSLYHAPNDIIYHRTTFLAQAVRRLENCRIDPDISAVHWLSYEEILANSDRMRSPLVVAAIEQYRKGLSSSLELIYE